MRYRGYDLFRRVVGLGAFTVALIYLIAVSIYTYIWWSSHTGTNVTSQQLAGTLFDTEFVLALAYAFANIIAALYFLRHTRRSFLSEGIWMGGLIGAMIPLALVDFDFMRVAVTSFTLLSDGEYGMIMYVIMLGFAMITIPSGMVVGGVTGVVVGQSKNVQR